MIISFHLFSDLYIWSDFVFSSSVWIVSFEPFLSLFVVWNSGRQATALWKPMGSQIKSKAVRDAHRGVVMCLCNINLGAGNTQLTCTVNLN